MAREVPMRDLARIVGAEVEETTRAIKIALFSGVIMDTRVGNPDGWKSPPPPGYVGGRLRGNWQTSTSAPVEQEIDRIDPQGAEATQEAVEGVTASGVDYLTNNLPYAAVWEERDAMVSRNAARIERIVREKTRVR